MKKVRDIFFKGADIRGEIGIEVEMEGANFPLQDINSWYSREDGSLRGDQEDSSREFVLIRPCKREDVANRVASLKSDLEEEQSVINESIRTSVHVHVNIRNLTTVQLYNFIFTYLIFEDLLMKYAGEEREGNLYCLRASDAEYLITEIARAIETKDLRTFNTDNVRYSSMNLKAVVKYGSLEFRGLPFSGDFDSIEVWTKLLLAVKDYALTLDTPRNLVDNISKLGPQRLAKDVFKDLIDILPQGHWNTMIEGVRRIQKLVYMTEWNEDATYYTINTKLEKQDEDIENNENIGHILDGLRGAIAVPPAIR